MTANDMRNRGAYTVVDRPPHVETGGRCCVQDSHDAITACYEPLEPGFTMDLYWSCWRESDAEGYDLDTRAKVTFTIDSNRPHAAGGATVAFSAGLLIWGDFRDAAAKGGGGIPIASAWIKAGRERVYSQRAAEDGLAIAEISTDLAFQLMQNIAEGSLITVSLHFTGDPYASLFQFMRPIDGRLGSRIQAELHSAKQALLMRANR